MGEPPIPSQTQEPAPRRPIAMLIGLALLLAILIGLALYLAPAEGDRAAAEAVAALALPKLSLNGLVAAREPSPHILRALSPEGKLAPGEALMLRARLSAPAFLCLVAQKSGAVAEPIWPATAERHDSGEFELDEGGEPLLLDPTLFGNGASLVLFACARAIDPAMFRTSTTLASPAATARAFPSCVSAELEVSLAK